MDLYFKTRDELWGKLTLATEENHKVLSEYHKERQQKQQFQLQQMQQYQSQMQQQMLHQYQQSPQSVLTQQTYPRSFLQSPPPTTTTGAQKF